MPGLSARAFFRLFSGGFCFYRNTFPFPRPFAVRRKQANFFSLLKKIRLSPVFVGVFFRRKQRKKPSPKSAIPIGNKIKIKFIKELHFQARKRAIFRKR